MATMSFARAFSMKHEKPNKIEPIYVGRAATQRGGRPVIRTQISSPTALISTSNVHVYTAQSIIGTRPIEIRQVSVSSNDSSSSDESDADSSLMSAGTITDASSIDESPISMSPESNPFSYLKPAISSGVRNANRSQSPNESIDPDVTPRIPQRAPSHSKAAHQELHHKLSLQRLQAPSSTIDDAPRSSFDMVSGKSSAKQSSLKPLLPAPTFHSFGDGVRSSFDIIGRPRVDTAPAQILFEEPSPISSIDSPGHNPFDNEIAQLQEVADGFGRAIRTAEEDRDVMHMEKHGLATFSATEYMSEIQSLIHSMFADEQPFFKALGSFF